MSGAYSTQNLKKSSLYFLVGKVGSGALTFVILILLARLLENTAYGAYVTLVALLELGYALGNLGIGWVGNRYIPEYRLHASSKELSLFTMGIIIVRMLALMVVAGIVLVCEGYLEHYLHLGGFPSVIHLYSFILVVEGVGRVIRDEVLASLLQQKTAQFILILRNVSLLLLILNETDGELDLLSFAWMDLYASLLATFLSLVGVIFYLVTLKQTRQADWQAPQFKQFFHTAQAMYASFLLTMASGQQVFMFIVNALLGLEAAAIFGFSSNLNNMLRRYLPAELLMGLIQPKLVADYVVHQDIQRLSNNARFAWKLSLVVLIPALSYFIVCGESFTALISDGKFVGAGPILAGLAISLIPFSQHRILETIANIVGHPKACVVASFMSTVSLPLTLILIYYGFGLWAVVVSLTLTEVVFNLSLVLRLKRRGCPYGLNLAMLSRLGILISAVTLIVGWAMNLPLQVWMQSLMTNQEQLQYILSLMSHVWIPQASAIFLAIVATGLLGWDVGFFSREERKSMLSFFNTKTK